MAQSPDNFERWPDGELLGLFARTAGEEPFAELVRRHGAVVAGQCYRVLGDRHAAEDAAQAVFLTLAQKAGELQVHPSVVGWLQRVAWHVALRARDAAAIRKRHEQEAAAMRAESAWPGPGDALRPDLDEELAQLPDKYRVPLILHYLESRSLEEVAALLNLRLWTVASQVRRGRELLGKRLAKRGVVLGGAAVVGLLTETTPVSAAFLATTSHAATLVAAGHAVAGGVVSMQTAALFKGTLHMMFWAKMKVAAGLLVAALLPIAAAVTMHLALAQAAVGQQGPVQPLGGNPGPGGGGATKQVEITTWPTKGTMPDYAKLQADALKKVIDVSYKRAYVSEVVADLEKRAAVRVAYPEALGDGWTFTLEQKGITVQAVLEKLAADGKFDLAQRPTASVLSQKADDQALAALEQQLASPDRWQRCQALWGLGNLPDPRVYPLLTKGLMEKDRGVVEWALRGFEQHRRMGPVMGSEAQTALARVVGAWLAEVAKMSMAPSFAEFEYGPEYGYRNWRPGLGMCARQGRADLLAATGRPEAIAQLIGAARDSKIFLVREGAVIALANARVGAAELLKLLDAVEAQIADLTTQEAAGKTVAEKMKFSYPLGTARGVRTNTILALVKLQVPEFVAKANEFIAKPDLTPEERNVTMPQFVAVGPAVLDLRAVLTRELKEWATLYEAAPAAAPGPNGAQPGTAMGVKPGYFAWQALKILNQMQDPVVTAALLKTIPDDKAFQAVAELCQWDPDQTVLPVDDPQIRAALLARLKGKGAMGIVALRSLANSHDPAVATALIAELKDPDEEWLVEVAAALAQTHDDRALAALVTTVTGKRDWSDLEGEDAEARKALMAKGGIDAMIAAGFQPPHTNARKALIRALLDTRDPQAFAVLVSLATDTKLDAEVQVTAREQLRGAPTTAAEMDRLMDMLKGAELKAQRQVLGGGGLGPYAFDAMAPLGGTIEHPRAIVRRCANDPRWVDLLVARTLDDEKGQRAEKHTGRLWFSMIGKQLGAIRTPLAEKALLDLCGNQDEHVAFYAARELRKFADPKIKVEMDR